MQVPPLAPSKEEVEGLQGALFHLPDTTSLPRPAPPCARHTGAKCGACVSCTEGSVYWYDIYLLGSRAVGFDAVALNRSALTLHSTIGLAV